MIVVNFCRALLAVYTANWSQRRKNETKRPQHYGVLHLCRFTALLCFERFYSSKHSYNALPEMSAYSSACSLFGGHAALDTIK